MVSKIMQTVHKYSKMNGFGITQPAVVGSVVSVGNNPLKNKNKRTRNQTYCVQQQSRSNGYSYMRQKIIYQLH